MKIANAVAAILNAEAEINAVIEIAVKDRNPNGMRSLTQAANNMTAAKKHVERAASQAEPS